MRLVKVMALMSSVLVGCLGWLPDALADDINVPFFAGFPNATFLFSEDLGQGLEIQNFIVTPGAFPLFDGDCGNGPGEPCLETTSNGVTTHVFSIPNFIDPLPIKLLRIQVTYFGPDATITFVAGGDPDCLPHIADGRGICPGVFGRHVVDTAETQDASYFFEDWVILPNPDFDGIVIEAGPGTTVHQVVIDTISIPLPASLLLYGGGFAGLLGYGWWRGRRPSTAA